MEVLNSTLWRIFSSVTSVSSVLRVLLSRQRHFNAEGAECTEMKKLSAEVGGPANVPAYSLFSIVVLCLSPAWGEERPDSFFSDNFAARPGSEQVDTSGFFSPPAPPKPAVTPAAAAERIPPTQQEDENFERAFGEPVTRVGVIVNGLDQAHTLEKVRELLDLAEKQKITLGPVHLVGFDLLQVQMSKPYLDLLTELSFRGVAADPDPPSENGLSVARSPTWLIETARGLHVVEGYERLTKLVNRNSHYIAPQFAEEKAAVD